MKIMKKAMAFFLCVVMTMAMGISAFATNVTVTGDDIQGHTFTAYQVFSGTQAEGSKELASVQWGSGINGDDFLTALKADSTLGSTFSSCTDAASVAEALAKNSSVADQFAKLAYANKKGEGTVLSTTADNDLASGYYLIVDTTDVNGKDQVANVAVLQVTGGDITINQKTDKPSVEKKVQENSSKYSTNGGYGAGYNDVADYNIGDAVPFHLIGTVVDMSKYDTYKYVFHDTLSKGLSVNNNIKVYLSDDKTVDANDTEVTSYFTTKAESADNGTNLTVSCSDLKKISGATKGKYIIVAYTANLNNSAKIGLPGNPNEVYLEYSNKPDQSGEGDRDNTGKTPEDKVIVFTYELDTTKVDGADTTKKLEGAEFELYKTVNGTKYYVQTGADNKVTGWTTTESEATSLKSGSDGLFKVIGLDDGTYFLKETKAPSGYNPVSTDIELTISATTTNNQTWAGNASDALTALKVTAGDEATNGNVDNGTVGITVENNKGATLPSTGGMGTTLFYVVGGLMMAGAAVLLVTKKRMA